MRLGNDPRKADLENLEYGLRRTLKKIRYFA